MSSQKSCLGRDTRARKRYAGFNDALSREGLSFVDSKIEDRPSTIKVGCELTADILRENPDLDCLYSSNDNLTAGWSFQCIASGLTVPDQLVLVGFNGLEFVESLPTKIATSQTPRRETGRVAAEMILSRSRGKAAGLGSQIEYIAEIELNHLF